MFDRGRSAGRGGGGRGGGYRGGGFARGGGRGGGSLGGDKPKKENILDLSKYIEKKIRVKFAGGREVTGTLKGFDPLLNLVLDATEEHLRSPEDNKLTDTTRQLGLVVCRGPSVNLISPVDGSEEIANPFVDDMGE